MNDWSHLRATSRRVGLVHALANTAALGLNVGSLAVRRSGRHGLGRALSTVAFALAGASAHLGGQLSFGRGVRVNRTAWEPAEDEWTAVLDEAELSEGAARRGRRRARRRHPRQRRRAVRDLRDLHAPRRPLDQGDREGDVVVCPWHGARFDLCNGEVVGGPAVFPPPRWEARVRDGKVEVRTAG